MPLLSKSPEADFIGFNYISTDKTLHGQGAERDTSETWKTHLILCSKRALGLFEDKYRLVNTLIRVNRVKPGLLLFHLATLEGTVYIKISSRLRVHQNSILAHLNLGFVPCPFLWPYGVPLLGQPLPRNWRIARLKVNLKKYF